MIGMPQYDHGGEIVVGWMEKGSKRIYGSVGLVYPTFLVEEIAISLELYYHVIAYSS